jgi:hypothetical protein
MNEHDIAIWLNEKTPDERLSALHFIKDCCDFCWQCGFNYPSLEDRRCHCENDE